MAPEEAVSMLVFMIIFNRKTVRALGDDSNIHIMPRYITPSVTKIVL